jgi:hypothetical protein
MKIEDSGLMIEYYDQTRDFLDKLFNLNVRVQKASRKFRSGRAAGHVEKDADGMDVLIEFQRIVQLKIEGLYKSTEPWLIDRLADAVAKRRQLFYYQRAHARRRGKAPQLPSNITAKDEKIPTVHSKQPITDGTQSSDIQVTRSRDVTKHHKMEADTRTQGSIETYTTASQLHFESEARPKRSSATPTRTELRIDESIFPPLPHKGPYETFQCTQCFEILLEAIRKRDSWKYAHFHISPLLIWLENIYLQTLGRTPAFQRPVLNMTNFLKPEKCGLIMKFNTIVMTGFVIYLVRIRPKFVCFHQTMRCGIIY